MSYVLSYIRNILKIEFIEAESGSMLTEAGVGMAKMGKS
jgi:hypothetical protein